MSKRHCIEILTVVTAAAIALSACGSSTADDVNDKSVKEDINTESGTDISSDSDTADGTADSDSGASSMQAEFDALTQNVDWDMSNFYIHMETDEKIDGNTYIRYEDANKNHFAAVKVGNPDTIRMVVELREERLPVLRIGGFEDNVDTFTVPDFVTFCNFSETENFKHVTWSGSFTTIPADTFSDCPWITSVGPVGSGASVEIPDTVEVIDKEAFLRCKNLTNVTVPDGIIQIKEYAFFGCDNLMDIEIPDTVIEIGEYAIPAREDRDSFALPSNIRFFGCRYEFERANEKIRFTWDMSDEYTEITRNSLIGLANGYVNYGGFEELKVPDSVMRIDPYFFENLVNYYRGIVEYDGQTFSRDEFLDYFGSLPDHELIMDRETDYENYMMLDDMDFYYLALYTGDIMQLDRDEANRSGEVFRFSEGWSEAEIKYEDGYWRIELFHNGQPAGRKGYFDDNYSVYPERPDEDAY